MISAVRLFLHACAPMLLKILHVDIWGTENLKLYYFKFKPKTLCSAFILIIILNDLFLAMRVEHFYENAH